MKRFFLFSLFCTITADAQVLIFTYAYNRPDFIEIQYQLFKKFLKDDYEFMVINDARTREMEHDINQMGNKLGLRVIRFPQHLHDKPYLKRWPKENYHSPAVRNCNVVQFSLNNYGFDHNDIVVSIDSDLFLVKEFSFRNHVKEYDIAATKSGWAGWLWIGYLVLDMRTLPEKRSFNVNCGQVDDKPVDAGGHTLYYLRNHPTINVKYVSNCHITGPITDKSHLNRLGCNECDARFLSKVPSGINLEYIHQSTFLHYRGGTNWDQKSSGYHAHKTSLLQQYVSDLLSS